MKNRIGAAVLIASLASAAATSPSLSQATKLFAEASTICARDDGNLWGHSICGPVLLVDWHDRSVIASAADADGILHQDGAVFRGVLPEDVVIANTPTNWSGTRWTQLVGPTPEDAAARHVLIAHELFHRVQQGLGLTLPEAPNHHLDTLEGRYLLQLEWRALSRAIGAPNATRRKTAIADALAFRWERYRLFPTAAAEEGALEINEGIAEYTGVRLGLETVPERVAFARHDLEAFVAAPTFVRSFAYATGPAYGLLLDKADPHWRAKIRDRRFDELLGIALGIRPAGATVAQSAKRYDDGTLRASEERRERERVARRAEYKARLVDGPVLILPLVHSNYQFNPQTLVPLEGQGTIYPTMRLVDDWGALEVESGGALVASSADRATVTAIGAKLDSFRGEGWALTLKPGWTIRPGLRSGDLVVAPEPTNPEESVKSDNEPLRHIWSRGDLSHGSDRSK